MFYFQPMQILEKLLSGVFVNILLSQIHILCVGLQSLRLSHFIWEQFHNFKEINEFYWKMKWGYYVNLSKWIVYTTSTHLSKLWDLYVKIDSILDFRLSY
jgi:hypothetical protein